MQSPIPQELFHAFFLILPIFCAILNILLMGMMFAFHRSYGWIRPYLLLFSWIILWMCLGGISPWVNSQNLLSFLKIQFILSALIATGVFHLSLNLTQRYSRQKYILWFLYAQVVMLLGWMNTYSILQEPATFYSLFILIGFLLSWFQMLHYYFVIHDVWQRRWTRFWLLGSVIIFLGIVENFSGIFLLTGFHFSLVMLAFFQSRHATQEKIRRLEEENSTKDQELANVVKELKATQLKFIEAGKVSTAAALSAGILHQISQPITAIHGFARFLKQEMNKDDRFFKPIEIMEEQTVYLKEMLENLMTLILHRKVEKDYVQVNRIIERAINLLVDELRIRRIRWDLSLLEKIPDIYADPVHLQQVFMNICVNAMDALSLRGKGEERILVVTSEYDASRHKIIVAIHNNGPQISDEVRDHMFEPYFTTKEKGSGIGLALCHDLLAEHGGKLSVESDTDGVTFYIELPAAKVVAL